MNATKNIATGLGFMLAGLMLVNQAAYAAIAGRAQFVIGSVQLVNAAGQTSPLKKGDAVNEGDTLTSAKAASAQIKMQDGGFIALRPDTKLKFDSFVFNGKEDGSEKSFFSLFKGGFRAITGVIGRANKTNYRITTATATLGIRGTDHETFVVTPGTSLANVAPTGTYNKVNVGETYMTTNKGTIFVLPNQMGYAGGMDQMPQLQPLNSNLFTVAPAPAPQGKVDKREGEAVRDTAVVDPNQQVQVAAVNTIPASISTPIVPICATDPATGQCVSLNLGGGNLPAVVLPATLNGYGHEVVAPSPRSCFDCAFNNILNHYDVLQPSTSYQLDGSNNLLGILNGVYYDNSHSLFNANIQFSGGVAQDAWQAADSSIYLGRWQGGNINVTGTGSSYPAVINGVFNFDVALGVASAHWLINANPSPGYVQTLVGTSNYTLAAATHPTDAFGNVGTLTSASFTANFTQQVVDMTLGISFSNKAFSVNGTGIPIRAENAWTDYGGTAMATCTGKDCVNTSYSAILWGRLAGNQAASASLAYNLIGSLGSDLVQGVAAFTTGTAPVVLTGGPYTAYVPGHVAVETTLQNSNSGMLVAPADLTYVAGGAGNLSASGALSSITNRDLVVSGAYVNTSTITGGTPTSADAPAYATTGIQYGAWTGYTGQSNTYTNQLGGKGGGWNSGSWMYGPQAYLDTTYLPQGPTGPLTGAMAGTFTYQMDGSTAPYSRNSGLTGTLTSASFTANFTSMLLTGSLALTMPGNENWGASVTNAPIILGSLLNAVPVVTYGVSVAPAACRTCSGNVSGAFTGQNLAGAILSYNLYNNATLGGSDVSGNVALTRNYAGNANPLVTNGAPVAPVNIQVAVAGQTGAVSTYPVASSTTTGNLLTAYGSGGMGAPNTNSTIVTCVTCTTTPSGQVATSGIYYGNWSAGSITQSYNSTFTAGMGAPTYWITGPEAGPLYLPMALTGTASFSFNGGQVSNSNGVAGTVAGTTALALDFNKQTVGINLDVSIASVAATPVVHAWNAKTLTGNEAVLGVMGQGLGGGAFYAATNPNVSGSGLLTVTVDGGATPVTAPFANINGQLTGSGLTGAILSFNLTGNLGATAPTFENIKGVAAFTAPFTSNIATPHRYVSIAYYDPFAPMPQPVLGFYANNATRVVQDAAGNLTQFDNQIVAKNNGGGSSTTFASNTSTLTNYGSDAVSGISWGRWAGGTINVTDRKTGVVTPVLSPASLHWIAEPIQTAAVTLPISGTYTYTNAGGTAPTDNLGNVGTLNSATLNANFTAQTVNVGVNVTVAGATLNAAGANVPIIQQTVFYASSQEPAASPSYLTVNCTGTPCGATGGTVIGKFTGAGAIGAAMSYGLQNGVTTASGVAAFHR